MRAQPLHWLPLLQTLILEVVGVVVRRQKAKVHSTGQIIQGTVREDLFDLGKLATEGNLGEQGLENKATRAVAEGKQELSALISQGELDLVSTLVKSDLVCV